MVREKGKAGDKGKGRPKKLSVKKQPIKDLDVPKGKDAKGGVAMTQEYTETHEEIKQRGPIGEKHLLTTVAQC